MTASCACVARGPSAPANCTVCLCANGCPPFLADYHQGLHVRIWQSVFSEAYDDFCHRVEALDRQLPDDFDADDPAHDARYDEMFGSLPMKNARLFAESA